MRTRIGMRWWLAGAFAVIAAITAVAVAEVFSTRSEDAFRERAQELAAGTAFRAAIAVTDASGGGALQSRVGPIADRTRLALFVFNDKGALLTPPRSRGLQVNAIPQRGPAVQTALEGRRFIATENGIEATVVALPLRAPGSAVSRRPPVQSRGGDSTRRSVRGFRTSSASLPRRSAAWESDWASPSTGSRRRATGAVVCLYAS